VLLALKSGVLAGESIHAALTAGDLHPERFRAYGEEIREGIENMRKLVYAFYNPAFSFKDVIMKHPEAGDLITDCLSGDLNRDYAQLWEWIRELAPLPDSLPYGLPLSAAEADERAGRAADFARRAALA
jgi:flavin-dependent dehydrogenase